MERTTILLTKIILNMEDDSMISGIKRGGDSNGNSSKNERI